ncbi:MAG: sulfonate ABC transporter ATP-binding protein, partial [Caulobacteraceae bacterium]|nr:sulfonate ABC transporter ATP-binding protein [Caulobacteraceae bacterium]
VLSLWRTHKPAVLLVTHDVDEAIALSDRVLVLDQGRIAAEEIIASERPRVSGPEWQSIRRRLLSHLGVQTPLAAAQPVAPAPESRGVLTFPTGETVQA